VRFLFVLLWFSAVEGWRPLVTRHCERPIYTCAMLRLTFGGDGWSLGAGPCPPI
jgi:hypothetical protein